MKSPSVFWCAASLMVPFRLTLSSANPFIFCTLHFTIWNDLPVDIRSTDNTREQFKHSLKIWLFECAYGRRRVWETVQSEGAPKKWTYLLTYFTSSHSAFEVCFMIVGFCHPCDLLEWSGRYPDNDGLPCTGVVWSCVAFYSVRHKKQPLKKNSLTLSKINQF